MTTATGVNLDAAKEALRRYEGTNDFLLDVRERAARYGLTERQAAAVLRVIEREEQDANAGDAPEGVATVTGEVVSTKYYESEYGTTLKMLVRLDNGAKVFCTVPKAIWTVPGDLVGARVEVTATWTQKERTFATGRRPKGRVLVRSAAMDAEAKARAPAEEPTFGCENEEHGHPVPLVGTEAEIIAHGQETERAETRYADQRAHDVARMTAQERNDIDSALDVLKSAREKETP
jgi:hypothetical protein